MTWIFARSTPQYELPSFLPLYKRGEWFLLSILLTKIVSLNTSSILTNEIQFDLVEQRELVPLDELNAAILAEDAKATR
jgi:hypothetical protein